MKKYKVRFGTPDTIHTTLHTMGSCFGLQPQQKMTVTDCSAHAQAHPPVNTKFQFTLNITNYQSIKQQIKKGKRIRDAFRLKKIVSIWTLSK